MKKYIKNLLILALIIMLYFTFKSFKIDTFIGIIHSISCLLILLTLGIMNQKKENLDEKKLKNINFIKYFFPVMSIIFGLIGFACYPKEFEKNKIVENPTEKVIDYSPIINSRKIWMDSILKVNKGYLVESNISINNDSVFFILNKDIKKFSNGESINESIIQESYNLNFANYPSKVILQFNSEAIGEINKNNEVIHLVNRQFAGFDGSNHYLVNYVKSNMNDPSTFEHIETKYNFDKKNKIVSVYMKFRGSNSVGSIIISEINAKIDLEGNIISTN